MILVKSFNNKCFNLLNHARFQGLIWLDCACNTFVASGFKLKLQSPFKQLLHGNIYVATSVGESSSNIKK